MKKVFFSLAMALMSVAMVNANVIWSANEGESHHVGWGENPEDNTPLFIGAEQFANARIGNTLKFTVQNATDVIELKSNGEILPYFLRISNVLPTDGTPYEWTIETSTSIDLLQAYGLEICGKSFDLTQVELLDGKALKEDVTTIWTGFFWITDFTTFTLYKNVLDREDLSKYSAIRFYHECPDDNYTMNLKGAFDDENDAYAIASINPWDDNANNCLQYHEGYAELDLTGLDIMKIINSVPEGAGNLLIQINDERQEKGFNFTDVVLVPKQGTPTQNVTVTVPAQEGIFDMLGRRLESVETTGFYIVNGKKTLIVK